MPVTSTFPVIYKRPFGIQINLCEVLSSPLRSGHHNNRVRTAQFTAHTTSGDHVQVFAVQLLCQRFIRVESLYIFHFMKLIYILYELNEL